MLRFGVILAVLGLSSVDTAAQVAPDGADSRSARDAALDHFNLGLALIDNENWEAAYLEFARSLELFPTRSALFNLGMCQKALHRYLQALDTFEGWLAAHAETAPAEERTTIEREVAELRSFVGELVAVVEPAGARVSIDGQPVGAAQLDGPIPVEVGTHSLEVAAEGYRAATRTFSLTSRQRVEVAVALEPESSATPPDGPGPGGTSIAVVEPAATDRAPGAPPPEDDPSAGGMSSAWFWTAASAAAATGIAGAVTGAMALVRDEDYADAVSRCQRGDSLACREGRTVASECDDWELATNVLLPAAGAFAAAALVLVFFTDFGDGAVEEPPVAVFAGPTVGTSGADGAAIGVSWRF